MAENATIITMGQDDEEETGSEEAAAKSEEKQFTQADVDRLLGDRLKRERDKLAAKYAGHDELKRKAAAAMSDQEKLVAEAEQRGRSTALQSTGGRLAKAEFRAAAAGKLSDEALSSFLEYVDITKFVDDDGEPDTKAISSAVKKLAGTAEKQSGSGSYDGGARTTAGKPADMNALIRQRAFGDNR